MLITEEIEHIQELQNNNINEYLEQEIDLESGQIYIPSTFTENLVSSPQTLPQDVQPSNIKNLVNSTQTPSQNDASELQPNDTKNLEQIPQNDANELQT